MSPELVQIRMLLTGAAEAVAEAERVNAAVASTGATTAEASAVSTEASAASAAASGKTASAAKNAEKSTSRLSSAHRTLGRAVMWGAGILGVGSVLALKAAYEHTQALGLATQKLQLQTGMNTRTASKWVEITQARGIQSTQLSMGFSTLAKQQAAANQGTSTSIDLFKRWGIGQKELKSMSSEQLLLKISDAFNKVHTSAGRAARAADIKTLFGRSGTNLLPLLSTGRKGIQEQLGQAGGIDKDQLKQIVAAKAAMRELGLEVTHLKDELAVALIPVILAVVKGLLAFVKGLEEGKTWAVAIAAAIGALIVAFTVLGIAAAVAWAIALGPVALIVAGIAALVAIFAVLYLKVGWFHDAVDAVWGFIKSHWPLLLLPLSLPIAALVMMIRHFHTIKSVAMAVFNWIKGAAHSVAGAISGAFNGVAGAVKGAFVAVVNAVIGAINGLISAFNSVFDRTIDSGLPGVPVFHGMHLDPIGLVGQAGDTSTAGSANQGRAHPGGKGTGRKMAASSAPFEPRRKSKADRGKSGDVILDKRKVGVVLHKWGKDEGARA